MINKFRKNNWLDSAFLPRSPPLCIEQSLWVALSCIGLLVLNGRQQKYSVQLVILKSFIFFLHGPVALRNQNKVMEFQRANYTCGLTFDGSRCMTFGHGLSVWARYFDFGDLKFI